MIRKVLTYVLAAAVVGAVASSAKAAINVQLSLQVTQPTTMTAGAGGPLTSGTTFQGGTWTVFATITGNTLGLGGVEFNITGDGNVVYYADLTHKTAISLPSTAENDDNSDQIPTGFELKKSTGSGGLNIAAYQDNTSYQLIEGADAAEDQTSILTGVGITAGSTEDDNGGSTNSWSFPVKVATGFYMGNSGDLIVSGSAVNFDALPASIPTLSLSNEQGTFTMLQVDTVNNGPEGGTGSASIAIGAVPEPASLGVLALGGLALLARKRRKA